MLREPRVTESWRETEEGFKEDEKGKRRASVVVQFEVIFGHPCFCVVCACTELFGLLRREKGRGKAVLSPSA